MGSMHKAHLLHIEVCYLVLKHLCDCFELQAKLAFFFHEIPFLLERMSDKLGLFQLGCLVDIFSKTNKENNCYH